MTTLNTTFGQFRGIKGDGVVRYLGIKYATLQDQLAVPMMIEDYGDEIVDATSFGPRCIAAEACQFEQNVLIQQPLETPEAPPMSGLECLNLNIVCPDIEIDRPLPVMVFIHGGGLLMGANWWPQYDPSRLVQLSVGINTPIIAVNFNYRLSALGNLTSQELRNAGYPGNNSLRDQRCALEWVKAHINGFGGDATSVTLFGESAGAACVLYQLSSRRSLFDRAISMSGTPIMLKPLEPQVLEMAYEVMMKELGLESASSGERVERLRTIKADELVAKTPLSLPLKPYVDGNIVPATTTFKSLASTSDMLGRGWCSKLLVGDCQDDGTVCLFMGLQSRKAGIASAFCDFFSAHLSDPVAVKAIFQAYHITPSTSDDEGMKIVLEFATDIAYTSPALALAKSWVGESWYYHFNEPNPWNGLFKGQSTHMLDAAFLFQNYKEKLKPEVNVIAAQLAKDFIAFANGVAPWPSFDDEKGCVRAYGPSKSEILGVVDKKRGDWRKRHTLFRLNQENKIDIDEVSSAWDKFLEGP